MHSGQEKDFSEAQKYLNAIDIAQRQLEETTKSKVYADLEKVYPRDLKVWINFLLPATCEVCSQLVLRLLYVFRVCLVCASPLILCTITTSCTLSEDAWKQCTTLLLCSLL